MDRWQSTFRTGFAPVLPTAGLKALRDALHADDKRLIQNSTTTPPPLNCVRDWPCEAADAIAFAFWQSDDDDGCPRRTVGAVADAFALACHKADVYLGELSACRWFLNWYDETPRADMRRELLFEVEREIDERFESTCPPATETVAELCF